MAQDARDALLGTWMTYGSGAHGPWVSFYTFQTDSTFRNIESVVPGIRGSGQTGEIPSGFGEVETGTYSLEGNILTVRPKSKTSGESRFNSYVFSVGDQNFLALTPENSQRSVVYYFKLVSDR
ncbi:MAG TPA: hypothetical protein VIT91_13350 [Chthoniobacterales bacterium]